MLDLIDYKQTKYTVSLCENAFIHVDLLTQMSLTTSQPHRGHDRVEQKK